MTVKIFICLKTYKISSVKFVNVKLFFVNIILSYINKTNFRLN